MVCVKSSSFVVVSLVDTPLSMFSGFGSGSFAYASLSLWFLQFILLGAVPFPSDVPQLKELGVCGVITLNEPYETLVPSSLYKVSYLMWPFCLLVSSMY